MKKILAFTGSNSSNSINKKLLQIAINEIEENSNFQVSFIDIDELSFPIYSLDEEKNGFPETVKEVYKAFTNSDAFLISSPEHNGLPSAFLKNIIDWLSRIEQPFFNNKSVFLLSTSPGKNGGNSHLILLEKFIPMWGGKSTTSFSLGNFFENYDEEKKTITDKTLKVELQKLLNEFIKSI
ncbi:NADPH-dependent FMN reductase [Aureivirga marina]|uniref:NADPH-dependent FMN reductase n=1 Tax=Aureivirga marina TaxID=1182451 RepID=UPI0018CB7912|nr:NAD(P)H-dependent oxidoreductase [Aureivirga marina]